MKSMTAFARRDKDLPLGQVAVEVRTINHRYLDVQLKLPDVFRAIEPEVRKRIGDVIHRGRVDIVVYMEKRQDAETQLELDVQFVQALAALTRQARAIWPDDGEFSISDLLRWPGVVRRIAPDRQTLADAALELFAEALTEVDAVRSREGRDIAQRLMNHLDQLENLVQQVTVLMPELEAHHCTRIMEKHAQYYAHIVEKLVASADKNHRALIMEKIKEDTEKTPQATLEQEVLQFLQKNDICEELDRLGIHLNEARKYLGGINKHEEPAGRYLNFLMQEFHREANTLGAKSVNARITDLSVKMRVLIERVREQVQNVE